MKKLKGNKRKDLLKEANFTPGAGTKEASREEIDLDLPVGARLAQIRARKQPTPQTPQSPPKKEKENLRARLLAPRLAKELGITAQEFIDGVKAGKYKLPEIPSSGDPNVIGAPDVPGMLIARQAAETIRAAAAPQMRARLGGKPQAETDPLSQIPKEVPGHLKEFALEINNSKITDQKKRDVIEALSNSEISKNLTRLAWLSEQLLKQTIGGKKVDMDYIADLILGNKEKAKAIFDYVRETKSGKFFNLLEEFFERGLLSKKELFPTEQQYREFAQSLKENKRYIKLAKILF